MTDIPDPCPTQFASALRHVARNCDGIECFCEPECPDERLLDRYDTASAILSALAQLRVLEAGIRRHREDVTRMVPYNRALWSLVNEGSE